jgi:hypothetical protein
MSENRPIPLYTKIGGRITIVLLLLLGFMLLRNCMGSVYYGTTTNQEEIQRYYDRGYMQGRRQAPDEQESDVTAATDNPLLRKAYRRGFRAGWDAVQQEKNIDQRQREDL